MEQILLMFLAILFVSGCSSDKSVTPEDYLAGYQMSMERVDVPAQV
ncbi:MAG: hypothetical protein K9L30_08110 [Desulfobacterales bacterium]|nr:hypothetical protein [Desulfobacterales bacterium]